MGREVSDFYNTDILINRNCVVIAYNRTNISSKSHSNSNRNPHSLYIVRSIKIMQSTKSDTKKIQITVRPLKKTLYVSI